MKYDELASIFPKLLQEVLEELQVDTKELQELRIRVERPVLAVCQNREYRSKTAVKRGELQEILAYLSNYSLYAYEDEVRCGFLSLPGGHRVGISGRTVLKDGKVRTMTDISSLNIRFAHEVKGCADGLLSRLRKDGRLLHTLIASAPGHGKTTLLRDCIRQISDGDERYPGMTVGVVDERSEIAGSFRGIPGNDIGMRTDVLDGCPKAEGMLLLIRSMAPKVVAVDEIGSREDMAALAQAINCGCVLLATVHGSSLKELTSRPVLGEMVQAGLFERYVFLAGQGQIHQILERTGKPLDGRRCRMLRLLGMVCILAGSTGIGIRMAKDLDLRIQELITLQHLMLTLRGAIRYMHQPLPEAFAGLAEKASEPFGTFFAGTAEELELRRGSTAEEVWRRNLQKDLKDLHLSAGELEAFADLGSMLGYLDVEMQVNTLDHYLEQLKLSTAQAAETAKSRRRIYRYLGALGGAALVILIF